MAPKYNYRNSRTHPRKSAEERAAIRARKAEEDEQRDQTWIIERDVVLRRYTLICNGEIWRISFDEVGEDHDVGPFRGVVPRPASLAENVRATEQVPGNASSSSRPERIR